MSELSYLTYNFTSDGIVFDLTITDLGGGRFAFDVAIDAGQSTQIGDIRAFYFDINGDVNQMGLAVEEVEGDSIVAATTDVALDETFVVDENDVKVVESKDTNMNGEVKKDAFDVGVEFGDQGAAQGDDYQAVSFILAGAEELTLADFVMQMIGVRLTSVGELGGSRDGSLKISDEIQDPEIVEPPVAADDAAVVCNDMADGELVNVLANDADPDGDDALLVVSSVNGGPVDAPFQIVTAGGRSVDVIVSNDGGVTLADPTQFADLEFGAIDSFSFDYTVADPDGGVDTATATITVDGCINEQNPNVEVNVLFLVDASASVQTSIDGVGGATAIFDGPALDLDGDGALGTTLDAQFHAVQQMIDRLGVELGAGANLDIGVATYSSGFPIGGASLDQPELLSDNGQTIFTGGDDLSTAFQGTIATGIAFFNAAMSGANDFFAFNDDGVDPGDSINLVYLLTDSFGLTAGGPDDLPLADELAALSSDHSAIAETVVFSTNLQTSPDIAAIEAALGDGTSKTLINSADRTNLVDSVGDVFMA